MNSRPRRKRHRPAEQAALVQAWQNSALSAEDFAAQHGVTAKTLYRWRLLASRPSTPSFVQLLPAEPRPKQSDERRQAAAEIERDGMVVRLYDTCPAQLCAPLVIAMLGSAKC